MAAHFAKDVCSRVECSRVLDECRCKRVHAGPARPWRGGFGLGSRGRGLQLARAQQKNEQSQGSAVKKWIPCKARQGGRGPGLPQAAAAAWALIAHTKQTNKHTHCDRSQLQARSQVQGAIAFRRGTRVAGESSCLSEAYRVGSTWPAGLAGWKSWEQSGNCLTSLPSLD